MQRKRFATSAHVRQSGADGMPLVPPQSCRINPAIASTRVYRWRPKEDLLENALAISLGTPPNRACAPGHAGKFPGLRRAQRILLDTFAQGK
jgi:hypothetical protein